MTFTPICCSTWPRIMTGSRPTRMNGAMRCTPCSPSRASPSRPRTMRPSPPRSPRPTNEQLLAHYMLDNARTHDEKLFYLGQQMENFRGTFFRQTMFAEFELRIHDMAEAGEGLSGESFTALYLELLRKYHGAGMQIDPLYAIEWAYIPHFYRNFYVFQYATSISGAVFFAQSVLGGGAGGARALSRRAAGRRLGLSDRDPEARRPRYDHAGALSGADRRVRPGARRGGKAAGAAGVACRLPRSGKSVSFAQRRRDAERKTRRSRSTDSRASASLREPSSLLTCDLECLIFLS